MRKTHSALPLWALPLLVFGGVQSATAYTPPEVGGDSTGIAQAGYPDFNSGANLTFAKLSSGSYKLTANTNTSDPFTFNTDATHSWNVTGSGGHGEGTFSLTANFNSSLAFQNGVVSITGEIPTYNGPGSLTYGYASGHNVKNTVGTLVAGNLTKFALDFEPSDPFGLGFTLAKNGETGWASQFQTVDESVWFYNLLNNNNMWNTITADLVNYARQKTWSVTFNNVEQVTTVPIPAAVWLLGSALLVMIIRLRGKEDVAFA